MLIDCFLFFNELDLLEIRLETLASVVDCFILVEATETFSSKPKSLVFENHRARFQRFNIHALKIDAFPPAITDTWQREKYSRDQLAVGLQALSLDPDDIVLLSNLDEIPRPQAIARCAEALAHDPLGTCYVFQQTLSYYFVNCKTPVPCHGTRMTRYRDVGTMAALAERQGVEIADAGWHFGYLGGVARIREKIEAFVHAELGLTDYVGLPEYKDTTDLERCVENCIENGTDLFGRRLPLQVVPFEASSEDAYPQFLIANQDRFASFIQSCRNDGLAEKLFHEAMETPSDIDQHLNFVYRLASTVNHITEMGTRTGQSTSAFLYSQPQRLVAYDLERSDAIAGLEAAAKASGIAFKFRQEDVLAIDIEPTDLLFIDTWHVEPQMREELRRHANKAQRYLILHDTETFGQIGEDGYKGIWPAVMAFMKTNPHWHLLHHFSHNNGLTVFSRR